MLEREYRETSEQVIRDAQKDLLDKLREYRDDGTRILLLLSGGSALKLLGEGFDYGVLGSHVTIGVLDERYTRNEEFSNYAQLVKLGFIGKAMEAGCQDVIDTRVKDEETIEELRTGYEIALHRWVENNPSGKIVATIGMGEDGHTAGIIPSGVDFAEKFKVTNQRWVETLSVPTQPEGAKERVTTTFNFLAMIAYGVMVVTGNGKSPALQRFANEEGSLMLTPARIWRQIDGCVKCYTDIKVEGSI